jgi:DNA-binding XRE family transcriptional regulator
VIDFNTETIHEKTSTQIWFSGEFSTRGAAMNARQKNFKSVVGLRVRRLRLQAQLTQEELAERCGIFRTYLSRIENGSANPTLVVLVALADCLCVEPHELLIIVAMDHAATAAALPVRL